MVIYYNVTIFRWYSLS